MTRETTGSQVTRRGALRLFLAGAGAYVAHACLSGVAEAQAPAATDIVFPQGVASGDPQPDGVVLWTRAIPADGTDAPVPLLAEVARDKNFTELVVSQPVQATAASDHTVRLFVDGLAPATTYFYRFRAGEVVSLPLGRTRTAPAADDPRPVVFATASCQNYQAGTYAAYRRMLIEDSDRPEAEQISAIVHLGDFIYEALYTEENPDGDFTQIGVREVKPFPSGGRTEGYWPHADSLDDYRHLYRTYLSDPDLMAARARWPFICTWDDHEFANDHWQSHDTFVGQGQPAQRRKVAANQAWFEYIPALLTGARGVADVAPAAQDFDAVTVQDAPIVGVDGQNRSTEPNNLAAIGSLTIYRSLRFGRTVELVVSDMRSYRSDHAVPENLAQDFVGGARSALPIWLVELLDAGASANGGNAPETIDHRGASFPNPRVTSPPGTMMGPDQKAWWKATMAGSDAIWKLWATSVPVVPLRFDFSQLSDELDDVVLSGDAWDGYPSERRELMAFLEAEGIVNTLAISGDHHASFAGTVTAQADGAPVIAEFSTPGISSASMYGLARQIDNESFRPLVSYWPWTLTGDAEEVTNLNTTLLYGVRAAAVAAYTGFADLGAWVRNPDHNAHLSHMDTAAHGYCVLTVTPEETRVEFVTIATPTDTERSHAVPVRNRIRYRVPVRVRDEDTLELDGPTFIGTPPFPMSV